MHDDDDDAMADGAFDPADESAEHAPQPEHAPPTAPPANAAPAVPPYTVNAGYGQTPKKPGKLTAIAIMMLISGIINCLYSLYYLVLAPFTMCLSLIVLPLILTCGILEIIHASKLLKDPIDVYKPATGIAVLEICCILVCSMYALVVGILALVFWGDPEVKQYYRDVALSRGYQPQV